MRAADFGARIAAGEIDWVSPASSFMSATSPSRRDRWTDSAPRRGCFSVLHAPDALDVLAARPLMDPIFARGLLACPDRGDLNARALDLGAPTGSRRASCKRLRRP